MSHKLDFLESIRAYLYPKLHSSLRLLGLYSIGKVGENQYVTTVDVPEDKLEKQLNHGEGFERNLIAAYKEHRGDGRESTLSLRLTHETRPELIEPGMQLHLTFLAALPDRQGTLDVYAHYEDNWESSPLAHLRSKNFSAELGVKKAKQILES